MLNEISLINFSKNHKISLKNFSDIICIFLKKKQKNKIANKDATTLIPFGDTRNTTYAVQNFIWIAYDTLYKFTMIDTKVLLVIRVNSILRVWSNNTNMVLKKSQLTWIFFRLPSNEILSKFGSLQAVIDCCVIFNQFCNSKTALMNDSWSCTASS